MTDSKEKIEIIEKFEISTDLDELLSGSLLEVSKKIESLADLEKELNPEFREKYPSFHGFEIVHLTHFDSSRLVLCGVRWESDEEFEKRQLFLEKKRIVLDKKKKEIEEAELAELARLSKKYANRAEV